jgi:hypothetical protein
MHLKPPDYCVGLRPREFSFELIRCRGQLSLPEVSAGRMQLRYMSIKMTKGRPTAFSLRIGRSEEPSRFLVFAAFSSSCFSGCT